MLKKEFLYIYFNIKVVENFIKLGIQFVNKGQFRVVVEYYKIVKGNEIYIVKSDKKRFQVFCFRVGCKWRLWVFCNKVQCQIKIIEGEYSCIFFNLEKGKRKMIIDWIVNNYLERFRLYFYMKLREVRSMVE